ARSNVAVIIDTPGRPTVHGVGQDQSLLGIHRNLTASESAGFGSTNHAQRFRISTGGAIKNQQPVAFHDQELVNWIPGPLRRRGSNLRVRSGENSFWSNVAICSPVEYQHAFGSTGSGAAISARADRQEDLIMFRVCRHGAESGITHTQYASLWSLDDANGSFLSVDRSAECQNCLCERAVHHDFIVDSIIGKT